MKKIKPLRKIGHGEERLIQFQCKEGTMFYYQSSMLNIPPWVRRCPCCGTVRIEATGRNYPALNENTALPQGRDLTPGANAPTIKSSAARTARQ
jgi:hypothetical protein